MTLDPTAVVTQQTPAAPVGIETTHHLRLWRCVDDNDVMARCVCGWIKIGRRLNEVSTAWAEHMGVITLEEHLGH